MDSKTYEQAAMAVVTRDGQEITDKALTVLRAASECDRLHALLIDDARTTAQRFEAFARELATGRVSLSCPTGYSTVRDIPENLARLVCKRDELAVLVRVLYGREARDQMNEAFNSK